ncbi:MAG: response regulator transcription factor [Gammaproteobacteria bacterium]|jgi:two-component system NarL family response regulator
MAAWNLEEPALPRTTCNKTLIVARQDFYVDGIMRLLKTSPVTGTILCVEPGEPCTRHFVSGHPDFLLIQEDAKPESFEAFIREMVDGFPGMRLLVFGQSMTDDYLYRLIQAGVHGYFNERMTGDHIIQGLDAVGRGEYWVERHIMQRFISAQSILNDINSRVRELGERLTPREVEVLELILKGLSTGEIAERVFLSHQGVKAHLTTLFRKFGVKNRTQLILRVLDEVSPLDSLTGLIQQGLHAFRLPDQRSAAG